MKNLVLLMVTTLLLSSCIIYIDDDNEGVLLHEERMLELDASNLSRLNANTAAGRLDIIGEPGRTNIEVLADIYYRDSKDIQLDLDANGSSARLVAALEERAGRNSRGHIDLVIKVPAGFSLTLEDGSGDTNILDLEGDIDVVDGSGRLRINSGASVTVDDGSGELLVSNIRGNANIKDGSGHVSVENIGGMVTMDDGSGDISIMNAGGLTLINSGSGGLKILSVGQVSTSP